MKPYAVTEANSKGRIYENTPHPYRDAFERDRDRVIHCSAFRRLEGKTQVFTPGQDDHYRTRLTHSIEVAQIGRTIAKCLGVNESLTEAICLAHDLGHSPFGHSGEEALNKIMAGSGGFEHNIQTLRVVEVLEHPYPAFPGLDLCYETRLGLSRHLSPYDPPHSDECIEKNCSLEGQIANIADRIAYNCHDLEDGLRAKAKVIDVPQVWELEIVKRAVVELREQDISDGFIRNVRVSKKILDSLVSDAIETSVKLIENAGIESLSDIYQRSEPLVGISNDSDSALRELESFLVENLYKSEKVRATTEEVAGWLERIFEYFYENTDEIPGYYRSFEQEYGRMRMVCDYISGMTDRFCMRMLEELDGRE
ncbi:dGTP triphosphohydrolase [Sedimentisphaera salicampi]|uniref:dGTP triphosphohydrolase n=1 Tax=Sedimentisphaera salicampi TaxID=1941349 RepID=UPI000B9B4D32|nr:dNTP triphosphohydrolase [Sedimentisphaera salicampi]OXU15252.1 Deoxyguanosinetriphosphate triphosphohydrolase [Sedimentisphaera salicampi]